MGATAQAWLLLLVAGLLEVVWAVGLKASEGFTRWLPSLVVAVGAVASFWLLAVAMRSLPAGTAYAVWTGIGAAGTAILGIAVYAEPAAAVRIACLALLIAAIVGLKLASVH